MGSDSKAVARVRKIDWRKVLEQCEIHDVVYIGVVDQSLRTHIRNGRFKYIDPKKYEAWTEAHEGSRTRARLYMRKKPDETSE